MSLGIAERVAVARVLADAIEAGLPGRTADPGRASGAPVGAQGFTADRRQRAVNAGLVGDAAAHLPPAAEHVGGTNFEAARVVRAMAESILPSRRKSCPIYVPLAKIPPMEPRRSENGPRRCEKTRD